MEVVLIADFRIPRSDRNPVECEDAAGFGKAGDGWVAAVSDGAGDAAFSRRWAACLVDQFLREPTNEITSTWLQKASEAFLSGLSLPNLPWYLWERLERGVFATLLGVYFEPTRSTLSAIAIGDSCLAWYGSSGEGFFPDLAAGDFGCLTFALGFKLSEPSSLEGLEVTRRDILLKPGITDIFLMSDALAAWYSRTRATGAQPWHTLADLSEKGDFGEWIDQQRAAGRLRDDDVTLLTLRVHIPI